jgi:hypothetical protein
MKRLVTFPGHDPGNPSFRAAGPGGDPGAGSTAGQTRFEDTDQLPGVESDCFADLTVEGKVLAVAGESPGPFESEQGKHDQRSGQEQDQGKDEGGSG